MIMFLEGSILKQTTIFVTILMINVIHAADTGANAAPKRVVWPFPTFGVEFEVPPGCIPIERQQSKTIGSFIRNGAAPGSVASMIIIDAGPPTAATLEQSAEEMARSFGGAVVGETTVDGEKAILIKAENKTNSLAPVLGVVTRREENSYFIMGGVVAGNACDKDIEFIRKSWRWSRPEPPVKHLSFFNSPRIEFDGRISLNFPALMYRVRTELVNDGHFGMFNPSKRRTEFLIYGRLLEIPTTTEPLSIDKVVENQGTLKTDPELRERFKKMFTLKSLGESIFVTNAVEIDAKTAAAMNAPAGKYCEITYGAVSLDESHVVFFSFSVFTDVKEDREVYKQLFERILKTVQPVKKTNVVRP